MSSFKRREPTHAAHPLGTRPSPSAHSALTVSTGIPSLDDVLGGGLPLGNVLVILTPDPHTAYGELLQRYFIAQGLASGQDVCIFDDAAIDLAMGCMWTPSIGAASEELDEEGEAEGSQVKIAWRYERMKQFQTSVSSPSHSVNDLYCIPLELTCGIPESVIASATASEQLCCVGSCTELREHPFDNLMAGIEKCLVRKTESEMQTRPLRLSIPSLGSAQWKDVNPQFILRLLHALRARLRGNPNEAPRACALITLPSYLSNDDWGGPGWSQKIGRLSDGCITLRSFSSDAALTSMFPSHHGLVNIHTLPSPNTLVPASDKFSQLRGLSSFSSSLIGGGENNLAFKCTRKRFVIETLHLDVEGGVSERRTTAPVAVDVGLVVPKEATASAPAVQVSVDEPAEQSKPVEKTKKKPKKSVAFRSDRPELYDF